MSFGILLTIASFSLFGAFGRLAAQAAPSVTVIGVVVDAASGAPVSAARVSLGIGAPGTATNGLGRFTLENVPVGTRKLTVTRLGYQDQEMVVEITDPMGGVRIPLAPDPVQLEGVSTKGATEGPLRGRVIDAETGDPVPWAPITLTRDGVKAVSRRLRSTDVNGDFDIPDVAIGRYVVKVERPDYSPQLLSINHQVPEAPLQITLKRDYRRQAALGELQAKFDERRNSMGGATVAIDAAVLQSAVGFMDQLRAPGGFNADDLGRPNAVTGETAALGAPILYVDGIAQISKILETYSPKEFYRVDYIACPNQGPRYMLAYTFQYIEDRMQNPTMKDPTILTC